MLDLIRIVKDIKCQAVHKSDLSLHTVCRYVSIGILIEMSSIQKDIINKCYGTKHMESVLLSDDNFSVYIRNLMRAIENCTKIYQITKNTHYFSVYKCTDAAIKILMEAHDARRRERQNDLSLGNINPYSLFSI
ncbi:hypothetical protein [Wolbachia endosymbiont of Phyllotreta cruciferae]|uniref:hypothetical protein n=2 Tax=Wolbachia endosymbiont of Phyllotreta cruciferae TaxID=2886377 RepID=UPI0020A0A82B|nr:hypothetical protein [Wolbachia endosymbiont of Phyllotreta cruciferae]